MLQNNRSYWLLKYRSKTFRQCSGKTFTIYKSFIRPQLNYADILYDKAENQNFQNELENVQYKAWLAINGVIPGNSRQKVYEELRLATIL